MGHFKLFRLLPVLRHGIVLICLSLGFVQGFAWAEPQFLEPEQAFQFSSRQIAVDRVEVSYRIADGYYMYRDRFKFEAIGASLGTPVFPAGHVKFDTTFQKTVETYRQSVVIQIPVTSKGSFTLVSHGQGCSEQGLCYAPMESRLTFSGVVAASQSASAVADISADAAGAGSEPDRLRTSLKSGRLLIIMPLFLLLGLGLAFTPCVLPMVPILSSIIVGEGAAVSRRRGVILSLSYAFGMSVVYTALGIAAGLLGEGLAATLQNPWVLGAFSVLLVGLSLSMFGVYQLQIPASWQSKLVQVSDTQRPGKLFGVLVMGALSALLVGPCVAAPLASALLYISQTHDVLIGGCALFSMAMGMSVPLLLVGLSAGFLLPRAGRWMESVKQLFGVLMLGMAIWLVSPVVPGWLQMMAWATLLITYGVILLRHSAWWVKAFAVLACVSGCIQLVGAVTGGNDVFSPLAHLTGKPVVRTEFIRISSRAELDQALSVASAQGKNVMLDFYADWCVSCKEMERLTFTDAKVKERLNHIVLLQVDVTANNAEDKALLKRFSLFGPPGMIFFGSNSRETGRVIGFQGAELFLSSLSAYLN